MANTKWYLKKEKEKKARQVAVLALQTAFGLEELLIKNCKQFFKTCLNRCFCMWNNWGKK